MAEKNDWWTAPATDDNGNIIMVTGRRDVDRFREKGHFKVRVTIRWNYSGNNQGFPDMETSQLMEQATEAFHEYMNGKVTAVLTGIYTGGGMREWVFYTTSSESFNRQLNHALKDLPLLPLEISAEFDPDWEEYLEMKEATEIL